MKKIIIGIILNILCILFINEIRDAKIEFVQTLNNTFSKTKELKNF